MKRIEGLYLKKGREINKTCFDEKRAGQFQHLGRNLRRGRQTSGVTEDSNYSHHIDGARQVERKNLCTI